MSGLATLVHPLLSTLWIVKDMWLRNSTQVQQLILHTLGSHQWIVYPQEEDPNVKINQYNYFNITGTIPPNTNNGIWGCLHFLPLVSNVFLARYDSGTFLSHLTDGQYGFDAIGSPGINMYQMYIVAPMVKAGMTYARVGLIYKPHGLLPGNVKRCTTFFRTFFDRCESEIDVAPSQAYFL